MFTKYLEECTLCPRNCKVNRTLDQRGRCKAGMMPKIALASLHFYEEPCISGEEGSGTIFFSGCNLGCKFCQNYEISHLGKGEECSIEELAEKFLDLQEQGANNINLVTGFAFVPQIIEALKIAKSRGLNIPIIYNTSGYESVETLKMLNGYIDVYLPDFKYYYKELSKELSNCENYFEVASLAIKEMVAQVGKPIFDEDGIIKKGVIIRHLVLPSHIQNSRKVLKWLKDNISKEIYISIMAQYFPTFEALKSQDINRKLNEEEFEEIENYVYKIGLKNGYIQYLEDEDESKFVPKWD